MTAPHATKLLTADEFYALPDPPEGGKMELIRGEVVTHMPAGGPHGDTALAIGAALRAFVHAHRLGRTGVEVGFRLSRDPDTVRAPDVHFVRAERLTDGRMPSAFFPGCPDLAVEVVSPDDTDAEMNKKLGQYLEASTPRVWIVRPEQETVTVHRPGGDAHTYASGDVLTSDDAGFAQPGFELLVSTIFE
ncbi:MAG: Uma2 family endonuclease [Chloroflexi bacterium]|nr:Uma2 family endonuclease [Chloroflexota bacterium]